MSTRPKPFCLPWAVADMPCPWPPKPRTRQPDHSQRNEVKSPPGLFQFFSQFFFPQFLQTTVLLKSPARNAKVSKVQDKTFVHSKLCKKCFSSTVFPEKCFSCPDIREKSPGFRKVQEKSGPLSKVHEKSALPQKNSRWSCQLKTQTARAISPDCRETAAKPAFV